MRRDAVTNTETEAFEAMLTHHRALEENVGLLVAALTSTVAAGSAHEAATAELAAFLADEVLPHALAEEQTIYRVAGTRAGLAETVTEMIGEHRSIAFAIEQLANIATGSEAAHQAESIAALFAAHVAKENALLLPPLLATAQVDLAQLLVQMQRVTESAREHRSPRTNWHPAARRLRRSIIGPALQG
jgi:hemerythrin-like domain-containing protein